MTESMVDISTAAARMGITPKAVRNRLGRGTLDGTKQDGRWYVALGPCTHHWMIETSSGPNSKGVCRLCKEEREFDNSLDASYWAEQAKKTREATADAQVPKVT